MAIKIGNSAKDSQYLKRIKDAISGEKNHPKNNGIKMQAHHIISGEGMKRSGLGKKIEKMGYDINLLPNLVFIPCTLQGACYLKIQPHRGNHNTTINEDDYDDDSEPLPYHEMVLRRLHALDLPLSKECPGDHLSKAEKVIGELNELSRKILLRIQMKPQEAPLTKLATHFADGGYGCGGVDSVSAHRGQQCCPVDRNHMYDPSFPENSQGKNQKNEKIVYSNIKKYRLTIGK